MNAVVEMKPGGGVLATSGSHMALAEILEREKLIQEVMKAVMKEDVHFGKIPGTDKPTLYKPGAEKLCTVFRIAPTYEVEDLSTDDSVRYRVTCIGTSQVSGTMLGTGMGECSSSEEKYKFIKAYKREWEATPETRRRKKFGWNNTAREEYEVLQVRTDPASVANTVLKMANKRAYIAMVLAVLAASDCFSQDLEDMEERLREHLTGKDVVDPAGGGGGGGKDPRGTGSGAGDAKPAYEDAKFAENLPKWRKRIEEGTKTAKDYIDWLESAFTITKAQKDAINACSTKKDEPPATAPAASEQPTTTAAAGTPAAEQDPFSAPTYAEVANKLAKAASAEDVDLVDDLIRAVESPEHRKELEQKSAERRAELAGGAQ
jgi:hypothetical protein